MVPETTPSPKLAPPRAVGQQSVPMRLALNLPNLITLARLLSVPLAIWLILEERYGAAFWVFVAAGLSDALDGFIAKHFDRRTRLGAMLDPAADKALLTSIYVALWIVAQLPGWLVFLVVLRDALIVLGFALLHATAAPRRLDPLYISKVNTLVQLTLVAFVLARGVGDATAPVKSLLIAAAAATTVLSGLSYLVRWARILARPDAAL
jgi:cardiolipin synthase (CMP-forming)